MNRRQDNRQNEYDTQKSSLRPRSSHAEHSMSVQSAINESLSSVHFNASDTRSVLNTLRCGRKQRPSGKRRRKFRPELIFTFSLFLMVALPLSLYAIRAKENITMIGADPGTTLQPLAVTQHDASIATPSPAAAVEESPAPFAAAISESDAIRIARECFNAHCDTSIFTFEEYGVSATLSSSAQYTVTLDSIYKNGCRFTVVLSAATGEVLQYSSPHLATVPEGVDESSPEIRAWFDKYGEHLFTWPQEVQAEYSRRYQGGILRGAKEGEISYETAIAAVRAPLDRQVPGEFNAFYPVLYSERTAADGNAFYLVYCYCADDDASLKESTPMTVSFNAVTGDIISIEGNPFEEELSFSTLDKSMKEEE